MQIISRQLINFYWINTLVSLAIRSRSRALSALQNPLSFPRPVSPSPTVIPTMPVLVCCAMYGLLLFKENDFKKLLQQHEYPVLNIKYTKQFIQSNQFKISTEHFQSFSVTGVNAVTHWQDSTRQVISVLLPPSLNTLELQLSAGQSITSPRSHTDMRSGQGWDTRRGSLLPVPAPPCQKEQRKTRARCTA